MIDPLIAQGVAFVTGAGSGIGQSIAEAFVQTGCTKLFLVDISEKGLQETDAILRKSNADVKATLRIGDVSKEDQVKALVEECVETYGRLDFACNNAGVAMSNISTTETSVELFDRIHNINFKGVFFCQKYEIAAMLKQEPLPGMKRAARGSIINTASLSGIAVIGGLSAYHSSKHGVISMTRVAAREYGKAGIRVNAMCPGFVETPMMFNSGLTPELLSSIAMQAPMERTMKPDDIADGVMYLHGSLAGAVTGIALSVDGGAHLYHT